MSNTILWATPSLFGSFAYNKEYEPVMEWDSEKNAYSDKQQTKNGIPVWQAQAIICAGYGAEMSLVKVRCLAKTKPVVTISQEKKLEALEVQELTFSAPNASKLPVGGGRHG